MITMEDHIAKTVSKLGISSNLLGHGYFCTAVEMARNDAELINSMIKRLYPAIALMYGKSPASIERAMRHAVQTSWDKGNRVMRGRFRKKPDNFHMIEYLSMIIEN